MIKLIFRFILPMIILIVADFYMFSHLPSSVYFENLNLNFEGSEEKNSFQLKDVLVDRKMENSQFVYNFKPANGEAVVLTQAHFSHTVIDDLIEKRHSNSKTTLTILNIMFIFVLIPFKKARNLSLFLPKTSPSNF